MRDRTRAEGGDERAHAPGRIRGDVGVASLEAEGDDATTGSTVVSRAGGLFERGIPEGQRVAPTVTGSRRWSAWATRWSPGG